MIKQVYFILISFLLVVGRVSGQEQPEVIAGFLGLDTRSSDFSVDKRFSRIAHNLDFGTFLGSMTPRHGYTFISTMAGVDSVVNNGMFPVTWLDNKKHIFLVADSLNVGYANVYVTTNDASVNITQDSITRIRQYWGAQTRPYFAQVNNQLFMSSADHHGLVYDYNTETTHEFPLRAPGALSIVPLVTSGNLDGQFSYTVVHTKRTTAVAAEEAETDTLIGVISEPVNVTNGKIFLYGFTPPVPDSADKLDRPQLFIKMPSDAVNGSNYTITIDGEVETYTADANDTFDSVMTHLVTLVNADPMGGWDVLAVKLDTNHMAVYANWTLSDSASGGDPGEDGRFTWIDTASLLTQDYDTSYTLTIYRVDNPKEVDFNDTVFTIQNVIIRFDDSVISPALVIGDGSLTAFRFTDNLATPTLFPLPISLDEIRGRDSTGIYVHRHGAPTFISSDSIPLADTSDTPSGGIYEGWLSPDTKLLGVSYFVTMFDTISQQESPPGPRLDILRQTEITDGNVENVYTIGLPKVPTNAVNTVLNLYRAPIVRTQEDSLVQFDTTIVGRNCITIIVGGLKVTECSDERIVRQRFKTVVARDSANVWNGRLIASLIPTSTATYTDSLRTDVILRNDGLHPELLFQAPPSLMKLMFTFQGRLFFAKGSRLYYSNLDLALIGENVAQFGTINFISINEGDGDEITMAYPDGDVIRVFKNESAYTVRQVDIPSPFLGQQFRGTNTFWIIAAKTDFFGVIAPESHLVGPEGHYFLSSVGMLLENGSPFLTRTFNVDTVSSRLKNFDLLSRAVKYGTVGQRIPTEQKYLWTIGDTTYVYDKISNTWGTWDLLLGSSIIFDATQANQIRAGQDMYFIKPGEATLLKYGGQTDGADTTVNIEYRSVPVVVSPGWKSLKRIGFWSTSSDSLSGVQVTMFDFKGDELDSIIVDSLQQRYNVISWDINDPNISKFYQIGLRNDTLVSDSTNLASTVIEAIEVWYKTEETPVRARPSQ